MIFFLFLLKTWIVGSRYNRLSEAVLTSTHNLCFGAKIRKKVYPCKPQFYYIKVGCKGVFVTRTCFRDVLYFVQNERYAFSGDFCEFSLQRSLSVLSFHRLFS